MDYYIHKLHKAFNGWVIVAGGGGGLNSIRLHNTTESNFKVDSKKYIWFDLSTFNSRE